MNRNRPHYLRHAFCSNCSSAFIVKDSHQLYGKRSPLILPCGHSLCETCIRDSLKANNKISCKTCQKEFTSDSLSSFENLRNEFPLNLFLVGSLFLRSYKSKVGDSLIAFKTKTNVSSTIKKATAPQNEPCVECTESNSDVSCKECNTTYCNECFDAVHKRARALQSHQKSYLKKSPQHDEPKFCSTHKDQKIEFFCISCGENTCSYCALCVHTGHEIVHKLTENLKKIDLLKENIEKADKLCKRYQHFKKKAVVAVKQDSGNDAIASAEKMVLAHFDYLHANLQLQEAKLLDELHKCRTQVEDSRQEIIKNLESAIQEIEDAVTASNDAMKTENLAWANMEEIIGNFDKILDKSTYVAIKEPVYETENKDGKDIIFSVTNENLLDVLNNHCQVKVPTLARFDLLTESDVPDDFVVEEIPVEVEPEVPVKGTFKKPSSIASSSGGTHSSEKSSAKIMLDADNIGFKNINPIKTVSPKAGTSTETASSSSVQKISSVSASGPVTTRRYDTDLTPGTMETVRICHFNNPSHFYVHRKGSDAELRNLVFECTRLKIQTRKHPLQVLEGSTYLVQFESDKKWYRGRVLKLENIERILVHYIDYGNTEYVSIESLRTIPPKLSLTSPLAINCKLYDCHPSSGLEWSTEAIKLMASIITGSILTMHVMRIDDLSDKLEVDLTKFHDDSRLSVRDALIFHELACFVVTNSISTDDNRTVRKGSYFTANDFKAGQTFDVSVTHVINPLNFYVQILNKNNSFMKNISRQMNEFYKRSSNDNFPAMVYSPTIGLPVAVFDFNGTWQRGQVTALPGNRQVEVMFVDTGETKTVPWENLRALQSKFLRMSAQAVQCALSHVIPAKKAVTWTPIAIKAFKNLVIKKRLKASVVEYTADSLKVALYECNELVDTCINALFVQSGHAISIGISSTLVEYPKYHTIKNPSSSHQNKPKQFPRPSSEKLERHESVSSVQSEVQSEVSNNEDICVKVEGTGSMRYAVTVKKIFNPGNFYVLFNIQNDQIKKLFDDMNMYYNSEDSKKNKDIEVDKGKLCAVFRQDDSQWYRGIIEEVLLDDNVKVLLKDIATTVVVNKSTLAELVEEFLQARDGTFKCRLAGVLAAGGQDTWPGIATDVFQEQVEEADDKLFFSQKGDVNPSDQCIPAELWVKRTVIGGPLEPAKEEWHSINRFLIDQGFALPDKSDPPTPAPSVLHGFSDKSSYSSLKLSEATENVTEWMKKTELLSEDSKAGKTALSRKPLKVARQPEAEDTKMPKAWPPPLPFNELNFMGLPTYVDHSCNIYIQDVSSIDTLEVIQRALLSRFMDSKPMAHDLYWFPGQLCIAQYHADKKWYRAQVLEVNSDNTVTVEMVDYGNVEVCKASELRKNICVAHIPVQCHKCSFKQLQPVSENGKWPISVLDFIHGTIVEKYCHVQLEGSLGAYNVVTLKCPGGLDLSEILLSMNYAKYILDITAEKDDDESASIIIEDELQGELQDIDCAVTQRSLSPPAPTDPETDLSCFEPEVGLPTDVMCDDSKMSWYDLVLRDEKKTERPRYSSIELPEDVDEFFAEVTSILSPSSVMIQIYHKNENTLADMRQKFNIIQDQLQTNSNCNPVLSNISAGDPCICQYSFDQKWYRGLVMDVFPNNTVKVKYVDYGNVEVTHKSNIRETTAEIMELPAQGLQCSFWGVKITDPSKLKECLEILEENIFSSPVLVKIRERTPELLVELFTEDGSELVYQKLIDRSIYETTEKIENAD